MTLIHVLLYPLPCLVIFSVLICVHEAGHLAVAWLCRVRIAEVSLGFGRELAGRTDGRGTRWRIGRLPFGGYVRMAGGRYAEDLFDTASLPVRAAVTLGGPLANFTLAWLLFAAIFMVDGQRVIAADIVQVRPDTPAAAAGLRPGDRILTIDGQPPTQAMHPLDKPIRIVLLRDGRQTRVTMPAQASWTGMGLVADQVSPYLRRAPPDALVQGAVTLWRTLAASAQSFWQFVRGDRPSTQIGGIGSMVQASHATAGRGPESILWLTALLSIGIGLFNLFPVPPLDGGHMLFFAVEAATGRPATPGFMATAMSLGSGLLVLLALLGLRNDLMHALHIAG